jgi:septal ring factor EnvC (AmiA/AmiB activator)
MSMIGKEGITAIMTEQWAKDQEEEPRRLLFEAVKTINELAVLLKTSKEIIAELQEDNRRLSNELERMKDEHR